MSSAKLSLENDSYELPVTVGSEGEVGVEEIVALGGAVDRPLGPYDSSMQLLETGLQFPGCALPDKVAAPSCAVSVVRP